jgi:integrase
MTDIVQREVPRKSELEFHPLADLFPLMEGAEFDALVADIKAHGLCEQIILYEDKILDGRNRYRACLAAGWSLGAILEMSINSDSWISDRWDPADYVISANIHRRHLTAEQKHDLIAKLLKAQPEKSNRQIAKIAKASPTTVGTERAKMEKAGDVSKLDTRVDSKGRKQPAKKKGKSRKPAEFDNCKTCGGRREIIVENFEGCGASLGKESIPCPKCRAEDFRALPLVLVLPEKYKEAERRKLIAQIEEIEADKDDPEASAGETESIAEKLRAAELKIVGLESEIEDLKRENADLRAQLEATKAVEPAAMPFADVPAFLAQLRERESVAALALEFTILTAARTSETLGAKWTEINLARKLWTVPAVRMKGGREHRVALSDRATPILEALAAAKTGRYVFPGQRPGKPLSSMAMEMVLRRTRAQGVTVHGFRSSFRDWCGEVSTFPREVAEAALAHVAGAQTERAYRRGTRLRSVAR